METVTTPKKRYEEMLEELERLRKVQEQIEDDGLLEQVKESLEEVKAGRVTKA